MSEVGDLCARCLEASCPGCKPPWRCEHCGSDNGIPAVRLAGTGMVCNACGWLVIDRPAIVPHGVEK